MIGRSMSKARNLVRFLRAEVGRFEEEQALRARFPGLHLASGVTIRSPTRFEPGPDTRLEEGVYINCGGDWAEDGYFTCGESCFVGAHSVIYAAGGVEFGHHVALAPHALITSHRHVFQAGPANYLDGTEFGAVKIGNNVVVNMGATIFPGVTIGDGAVIGAQAVVTKDVPAGCVVMGIPARVVRRVGEG